MKAKMGESVQLQTRRNKAAKSTLTWYLFLLPTLLGIACFILYPVFESFRLSFYRSNGTIETWIGLGNYQRVLSSSAFWNAVYNTFYIAFFSCC